MRLTYPVRLALFGLHIAAGLCTSTLVFPFCTQAGRLGRIQRWSLRLLSICGVTLVADAPLQGTAGALVVANHISWLDIFILNAYQPCQFIAKSEVRRWPVLGWLAARAGTIFIERSNVRALGPLLHRVASSLENGGRIAYFPEGTSSPQGAMLPFHPALFEAACSAAVPVQPVALGYFDAQGQAHCGAEYVGTTSFAQSVRRILSGPPITARLACLPPIAAEGHQRRTLALAAHKAVARSLGDLGRS